MLIFLRCASAFRHWSASTGVSLTRRASSVCRAEKAQIDLRKAQVPPTATEYGSVRLGSFPMSQLRVERRSGANRRL